jgi:DnaK suppressor protein
LRRSASGSSRAGPPTPAQAPPARQESTADHSAGDFNNENLYEDEVAAGQEGDLQRRLTAVERAEERLAAGTYGLSTRSGEPIPDGRLEAEPLAELTVDEEPGGTKKW